MDDELLASWAGRSPEERQSIVTVKDPEIVRLISANMSLLWTAEIQARQSGVMGLVHPFDQSQLPLLSTMEFDHASGRGDPSLSLVKWPKVFYEDPMVLPSVLRCALPAAGGAARRAPRALRPQRWSQLLQPPAKSWAGFEKQLARLVEQLVLSAPAAVHHGGGSHGGMEVCGDAEAGEVPEANVPGAARAAKRQRQRERRRLGKAHVNAPSTEEAAASLSAGEELAGGAPDAAAALPERGGAPGAAGEAKAAEDAAAASLAAGGAAPLDAGGLAAGRGAWLGGAQRSGPEAEVLIFSSLQKQVERMTLGFESGLPAKLAAPQAAGTRTAGLQREEPAPRGLAAGELGAKAGEALSQGAGEDSAGLPRGFGQGRPIGAEAQLPWHGPHGRGMGRGKALAPPPGLQGLQFEQNQKIPHGLAQPWIPGPAIPEDEDEFSSPVHRWSEPQAGPAYLRELELPPAAAPGLGGERTPSCWASYAPTPVMDYEQTPSPGSPAPMGLPVPPGGPLAELLGSAAASRAGNIGELSAYLPGVIPMYVTVPVALAHACPHCGKHFALPPGQEAAAAGLAATDFGSEEPPG